MEKSTIDYDGNFNWDILGNLDEGRKNLGPDMPVLVYRLFQYTLRDVLSKRYGTDECVQILRDCGYLAGSELTEHLLDTTLNIDDFISQLKNTLLSLKIGVIRIEAFDRDTGNMSLTVSEDLDCSGLPVVGESVCNYDEGFIAGILDKYTKRKYNVVEIDCWAKGDRVCRFTADVVGK